MLKYRIQRKLDDLGQFAIDVVFDRRHGKRAAAFALFLKACSRLFSGLVQLRLWLFRNRILHDHHLGCLVVVVGNLTVGGTGKTPVVEKFARSLAQRGRRVAILSRGYKSRNEKFYRRWWRTIVTGGEPPPPRVVSDGKNVLLDSETAGDEPYMLAHNLPGVIVLVDPNRVKSGSYAVRKFGCDTLVLDDGFQYLALKGRLNLLLIDSTNPFGNGHLLPRGILREPIKHIKRASYVFLTKSKGRRDLHLREVIERHNPGVDVIECAHRPQYLQVLHGTEKFGLEMLQGARVGAFSGIAVPESFEAFLRDYGANLLYTRRFLDHHRFSAVELEHIWQQAVEAELEFLVTTEKDAVRIPAGQQFPLRVYYLRLEIEILSGVKDFQEAVSRICFPESLRAAALDTPT
ncbi:MAG TPA: tetraacyldisaccharide 4'-kinase [Opitutaceae bacterium]